MTVARFLLICCVLSMGTGMASAQQPTLLVKAHLEPADVTNAEPAQLIVELQAAQSTGDLCMEITPPSGFQIKQPATIKISSFQGEYLPSPFLLGRSKTGAAVGSNTLQVRVFPVKGAANAATTHTSVSFNYVSRMSIPAYLILGGVGILIGYFLRLLIKTLQAVPPPPLAPTEAAVLGPFTTFVKNHYYWVDCSVTLVVGLLSLVALLKNNHVPDSGLYWYSTLGAGVALGLLTNSELLSKVR